MLPPARHDDFVGKRSLGRQTVHHRNWCMNSATPGVVDCASPSGNKAVKVISDHVRFGRYRSPRSASRLYSHADAGDRSCAEEPSACGRVKEIWELLTFPWVV
jgi:hypothetical protein